MEDGVRRAGGRTSWSRAARDRHDVEALKGLTGNLDIPIGLIYLADTWSSAALPT